jgi:hypothetical protein
MIYLASVFYPHMKIERNLAPAFISTHCSFFLIQPILYNDVFSLSFLSRHKIERNLAPASISSHCPFFLIQPILYLISLASVFYRDIKIERNLAPLSSHLIVLSFSYSTTNTVHDFFNLFSIQT